MWQRDRWIGAYLGMIDLGVALDRFTRGYLLTGSAANAPLDEAGRIWLIALHALLFAPDA